MSKLSKKKQGWIKRKLRTRRKIFGRGDTPRLAVFRSSKHIYAQVIDDIKGVTLVSASSMEKGLKGKVKGTKEGAKKVGLALGKKAIQKGIKAIVFDRHGFQYHGRVRALAEGAREAGLKF